MRDAFLRLTGAAALAAIGVVGSSAGRADSAAAMVFSGSAAASGMQLRMTVPGAPVTDTPIDGGGPTAQVQMDSIGESTGYASFPDPGGILLTGPTTFTGLLAGGVGPLPPVAFPAPPPDYPFYVSSNAASAPERSVGSGPYELAAASEPQSSTASATAGFRTGLTGDLALVKSTARMKVTESGAVVAEATSDATGLTVGPLVIGEVKSTAKQVLTPDGTVTPSTALEITGMRIGTLPVSFTPDGLVVGSATQKAPVNETLASLLAPSQISLVVLREQRFPNRVVAPAIRLDLPAPSASGKGQGTVSLIVGRASVALTGQAAESDALGDLPAVGDDGASGSEAGQPEWASGAPPAAEPSPAPDAAGTADAISGSDLLFSSGGLSGEGSSAAPAEPPPATATPAAGSEAAAGVVRSAASQRIVRSFELGSLYLTVAFGAAGALTLGALARLIGARKP